jgi:hypothetical protein
LVITNLHLMREADSWKLRMATAWQGTAGDPAPSEFSNAVVRLRAQLSTGPFHLAPLGSVEKEAPHRAGTGPKTAAGDQFVIEGIIR